MYNIQVIGANNMDADNIISISFKEKLISR